MPPSTKGRFYDYRRINELVLIQHLIVLTSTSGEPSSTSDGRAYSPPACSPMYSVGLKCNKTANTESSLDGGRNYYHLVVKCQT